MGWVGLGLGNYHDTSNGGYLYVFTKMLHVKVVSLQLFYWVECWF